MIEDRAYEEKIKHLWLVLFEFISKLINSFYLIVAEKFMGKNVFDDV